MKIDEIFDIKGGVVKFHPIGYLKKVQSLSLISSLKKRRVVETNVRIVSNIMDSLFLDSYPTPCNLLSYDNKKAQSKRLSFIPKTRSLNNLVRDNHFSYNNYNKLVLNVA